jgi:dolichol-phosphate mannosyltransferase
MRVLVVVPTYNERENVELLLPAVRSSAPDADILVVDDSSPDGTGDAVAEIAVELGQISLLRREGKKGFGSALREGFECALDRGYDVVVSMDVDLSHDPEVLPEFIRLIEAGADAVIGSRYVPGGTTVNWPLYRRVMSRWGNRYTSLVLRLQVRDCTSGYRAYRAAALRRLDLDHVRAYGYGFQVEMTYRLVRQGGRVVEIPVAFVDRQAGESKMSLPIVLEAFALVTGWGVRDVVTGRRRRTPPVTGLSSSP